MRRRSLVLVVGAWAAMASLAHATEPEPTTPAPVTPAAPATPNAPAAPDPEALLERAARCLRRGDLPCAESESTQLLILPNVAPDVAREAAAIAVSALARQDKTAAAAAACVRLRSLWPSWSPPPDADPRIGAACTAVPTTTSDPKAADPDKAANPDKPTDPDKAADPKPAAAKPTKPPKVKGPPREPRFSLSLGAGIGLPLGASSDRFDPGMHAALDFRWFPNTCWALWIQATLTLLPLTSGLPVEPGGGSGLTTFTAVIGVERRFPIATDLELSLAAGLGIGGFGVRGATDAMGLGLAASAGVRWRADRNLALRADFAPVATLPFEDGIGLGGHLGFIVRGEASF
jgi:hypothetical protein